MLHSKIVLFGRKAHSHGIFIRIFKAEMLYRLVLPHDGRGVVAHTQPCYIGLIATHRPFEHPHGEKRNRRGVQCV
jgi:hypothetical protein